MNITELAIKNRALVLSFLVIIVISGVSVFNEMPRDDMPPFLVRYVNIVTQFSGASPERVEMLVTDKIEKVIQEIPEIDHIKSESRTGISIVTIAIQDSEMVLRPIFDTIRRKVESVQSQLPDGVTPKVDDEIGDVFGMLIGITGSDYTYAELKEIADDVRDGLIKIPNAAKVEIVGSQQEQVFIEYDDAKLATFGLTKAHIQNLIGTKNIIFSGGDIRLDRERIILEPSGNFEGIDDLKKTLLPIKDKSNLVYLGDVTHIYRGYKNPPSEIVRINGDKGLVLAISLKKGGNIIKLGQHIDQNLDKYKEVYPIGIDFHRVAYQDTVVDKSVKDFIGNLGQSLCVVMFVMLIFLGFRTGMVVASLIPATIVLTLLIMSLIDVGLNKVTLASLIIALGMLVDNAIVVTESIMVKMEDNKNAINAAIESSKELMIPLLTSTMTTSAAFVSFFLAASVMGEIMGNIFIVVSIALISSWFLSLTLVPLLAIFFIKVKNKHDILVEKSGNSPSLSIFDRMQRAYGRLLVFNLKVPYVIIIGTVALFILSLKLFGFLPFIFFPDSDRPLISANIELPVGTAIEKTDAVVKKIEAYIRKNLVVGDQRSEGIINWSSYIGQGAPKYDLGYSPPESAPYSAHILMNTTSDSINQHIIDKVYQFCFVNFPDISAQVSRLKSGGGSSDPVAIRILGDSPETLYRIVDRIKEKLASISGTKNVKDNWGMRTKKFVIRIDPLKVHMAGITNTDVATSLKTFLTGAKVGSYREGDKTLPIMMRNEKDISHNIGKLESLSIFAQESGISVPLKQVAEIEIAWEASKVKRRDLYRTITVTSDLVSGQTAAAVIAQIKPWLEKQKQAWEPGYTYNLGGESEDSAKAMGAVIKYLPLSFIVIVLLLIGQFNSFRKPLIVLLTIPMGLIGVIFGLLGTGSYFSFLGFLGVISLSGVVINNGIVLIDRIKIEQEVFKRSPIDAIVEAALQRFRPILLTTATTSLGLIPLWLGGGEMWEPMAIGIIFGLLFATVLTLLFVPVLYKLFFRIKMA